MQLLQNLEKYNVAEVEKQVIAVTYFDFFEWCVTRFARDVERMAVEGHDWCHTFLRRCFLAVVLNTKNRPKHLLGSIFMLHFLLDL